MNGLFRPTDVASGCTNGNAPYRSPRWRTSSRPTVFTHNGYETGRGSHSHSLVRNDHSLA